MNLGLRQFVGLEWHLIDLATIDHGDDLIFAICVEFSFFKSIIFYDYLLLPS